IAKASRRFLIDKQLNTNCGDKGPVRTLPLRSRRPGVVVARHLRAMLIGQHRALWAVSRRRARQIGSMRLLPVARLVAIAWRCDVDAMMDPAVPAGRNGRSFRIVAVDNPAAHAAFRIDAAFIVDIASLILADPLAVPPGVQSRSKRLAVPPGE